MIENEQIDKFVLVEVLTKWSCVFHRDGNGIRIEIENVHKGNQNKNLSEMK